jgi:hypothetical protein
MKCTLAFSRTKSAHNNQLEMELEDGGSAAVALKNDGCALALGGCVGRRLKIAAAAWAAVAAEEHATCNDCIGISVVKSEGLLLERWRQRQQGWQERMLPMQGTSVGMVRR